LFYIFMNSSIHELSISPPLRRRAQLHSVLE